MEVEEFCCYLMLHEQMRRQHESMPDLESESEGSKEVTSKADVVESSESHQDAGVFSLFGEPGTGLLHHQWMLIKALSNETAAVTSQADVKEAAGLPADD